MLGMPPPGYDVSAINRQSNQLLGKPGEQTPSSPALGIATGPALSTNPMTSLPPALQNIVKLLRGGK